MAQFEKGRKEKDGWRHVGLHFREAEQVGRGQRIGEKIAEWCGRSYQGVIAFKQLGEDKGGGTFR